MFFQFGVSRRIVLVATTSLIVAGAVAWAGYPDKPQASAPPAGPAVATPVAAPAVATRAVLVAGQTLAAGAPLTDDAVASVLVLADQMGATFLSDTAENRQALSQMVAGRAIPQGSPFVQSDLEVTAPVAVAAPLPPAPDAMHLGADMRAMSVAVSPETAVSGLLENGDRVDVMESYQDQSGLRAIRTVLRNVRIVAIDQRVGQKTDTATRQPSTITLELHPEGTKVLALAQRTGELILTLSPPSDSAMPEIANDQPLLSTHISGEKELMPRASSSATVQVVRGASSGQRTVGFPSVAGQGAVNGLSGAETRGDASLN